MSQVAATEAMKSLEVDHDALSIKASMNPVLIQPGIWNYSYTRSRVSFSLIPTH